MKPAIELKSNQTIVFIGDSITDADRTLPAYKPFGAGYVHFTAYYLLAKYPQLNLNIVNTGISGNTIEDLKQRWEKDCLSYSPDILSVMNAGNTQGVPTLAITNTQGSPITEKADYVIDINAGHETAVAASKTYTAQLMVIAMLSVALSEDYSKLDELMVIPEYIQKVFELEAIIEDAARKFFYMKQCVVLGRGFNYATAFEWSLKLKELAYIIAEPFSSADFLHGPIAIVEENFPILAITSDGAVFKELFELLIRLKHEYKAELLVISNNDEALALSN